MNYFYIKYRQFKGWIKSKFKRDTNLTQVNSDKCNGAGFSFDISSLFDSILDGLGNINID